MLKNYFKIAFRNFVRHLGYTAINVFGLAVGLATAIFIFLWVLDEYSYDKFHVNDKLLFKVMSNNIYSDGSIETYSATPGPLSDALTKEIPEVEYAIRTTYIGKILMKNKETSLLELGMWADPELFKGFSFPIIVGDKENPFHNNNSIAISKSIAEKYFPNENPLGKVFKIDERFEMVVSAVFDDIPRNSTMIFDFVLPFEVYSKENSWLEHWENSSIQTYVKLFASASVEKVNAQMKLLMERKCKDCMGVPVLQRYSDQRLYSFFENGKISGGRIEYVRIFIAVAIFILTIACVNFINLSTARANMRSLEVGIRKVMGARRKQLVFQFMGESFFITVFALFLAVLWVKMLLPSFNLLTGKRAMLEFSSPFFIIALLGVSLFTSLLAGFYPALFLSSFKPVSIFKGNNTHYFSGAGFRKGLVVFQFSISIVLIIGASVIYDQTNYIRQKNLGFEKENILTFRFRSDLKKNLEVFKSEALNYSGIKAIGSASAQSPNAVATMTIDLDWPGKSSNEDIPFKVITCDHDFIPALNMKIVDGRNFSSNYVLDSANYLINEAAVKAMGLEDPVGTSLEMWRTNGQIIGVVKDFHNQDFRQAISPLVFTTNPEDTGVMYANLDGRNIDGSINHLKTLYKEFEPGYPFEYTFLKEEFTRQYESEATLGKLMIYFTIVAIFISCLGLLGLSAFTVEQRTKEVGIRKSLGASIGNIVALLSMDFIKLVMISIIIALPAAWFVMNNWLENYAYRTTIKPGYLVMAGLAALIIALLTVSYQAIKAALANPVDSLRND